MSIAIPMLDLMFFASERRDSPRHVGALLIFEPPGRDVAGVVERVVAAYRRARPVPPFNRVADFSRPGRPVWREVDRLDMDWHVQAATLPSPGSERQLHEFVARLHEPILERDRPGWQVYVIDGLARRRFALYIKVHHALVDGESGMALLFRSLSASAHERRVRPLIATRLPDAHPPAGRARSGGRAPAAKAPAEPHEPATALAVRHALSIGLGALRLLTDGLSGLRGFSAEEDRPFTAPATPMNEPIRSARTVAHTVLPLSRVRSVARSHGATVNDVGLCVLDAALHRYLRAIDRPLERALVATCPVSLQDAEVKRASTQVSVLWVPLGAPSASIRNRMRQVITSTRAAKQRLAALPRDAAYAYSVMTFAAAEALARANPAPGGLLLPSNVLISNVRGPAEPLYLAGARLEALCPFSTLIAGIGLNITFMSCGGSVVFGYTANAAALPGAERLAKYTRDAFAALERAARSPAAGRRAAPPQVAAEASG